MYELNGPAEFDSSSAHGIDWEAELLGLEVRS